MENLIEHIVAYLTYLNKDCGLFVSVHFEAGIFSHMNKSLASALLPYNYHTNTYCIMVKNAKHNQCILNQKNILAKCQNREAFCHTCHAGVYEYIYPVFRSNYSVGFITVSGYRNNHLTQCNIPNRNIWENSLDAELPLQLCHSLIPPLCIMLECALDRYLKEHVDEYNQILQFLKEHHTNITLSALSQHFNRSKSHISHLFKKESGMTIRAYCNAQKLEDAKQLLLKTDMPITEIAFNVGFNDTSYFIHMFKNKFGISPLQYRKNQNL